MKTQETITEQIVGNLDFLYKAILEESKSLFVTGYDAETDGVKFDGQNTLLECFFKNKDQILKGGFNGTIAEAIGGGHYHSNYDNIYLISEKISNGSILIIITINNHNYIYDGRNDDSYWGKETKSFLIKLD